MALDCVYNGGKTICCCETDGRSECKYRGKALPEVPGTMPNPNAMAALAMRARGIVPDRNAFRTAPTGASRDLDSGKPDFEAMLSPLVMEAYGEYMTRKRKMADGSLREADNWKKGMPLEWFIKSAWRHLVDWWKHHRHEGVTTETLSDTLCAILFNASGYLHEHLKNVRKEAGEQQSVSSKKS